jgi:hypothetical protein
MRTIRLLTASLFFTLIPLHDNEKCERYFLKASELLNMDLKDNSNKAGRGPLQSTAAF